MAYLRENVHLGPQKAKSPVVITFHAPTEQEMIDAGLNAEGVKRIRRVPWWEEMVADIAETPDWCDPGDPPQDMIFYRRYLAPDAGPGGDVKRRSFLWGYFFHLIADRLWFDQIARPTKARFLEQFEADKDFIWEVKRDWYGLDFMYVRDHPDSIFWRVFLVCEYEADYLDFLPPEAIRRNIDYIREYYRRTDEKVQALFERPHIYLSKAGMDDFTAKTSDRLHRIYMYLKQGKPVSQDIASSLDIPV